MAFAAGTVGAEPPLAEVELLTAGTEAVCWQLARVRQSAAVRRMVESIGLN